MLSSDFELSASRSRCFISGTEERCFNIVHGFLREVNQITSPNHSPGFALARVKDVSEGVHARKGL